MVILGTVCGNAEPSRCLNSVDVCTEEDKLPPVLCLLSLDLSLDLLCRVFTAGVFLTVCDDDEHHLFSAVIIGGMFLGITDFVDCSANCVKERGWTADLVLLLGNRTDCLDVDTVVEQFVVVIEQHRCDMTFTLNRLLFGKHWVVTTYSVGFQSTHRAAFVQYKYQFS